MRLQPLVLSVRESGRTGGGAQSSCPFCGVRFAEGQEPFLCPDGSADFSCAPCHLVRHLERDTIAEEAVLIWLPEMTQAALNALAHGAHNAWRATARLRGRRVRSLSPLMRFPMVRSKRSARSRRGALRRKRGSAHLRPACSALRSCA